MTSSPRRPRRTDEQAVADARRPGEVAARLHRYAQDYSGRWQWAWTRRAEHDTCRSFQDALLRAAGLTKGLAHLASRGSGCPVLSRPRTLLLRAQDLLDAARRPQA